MMRHRLICFIALSLGLPARGEAQSEWLGRPAVPADSVSHSIAEAEERGSRHPRAGSNNRHPSAANFRGFSERRCVNIDSDAMRSGDFIAGPFDWYNDVWRQGYGKIWWHPTEMQTPAPVLLVQAARLDQEAEARIYEARDIAWPSGPRESEATSFKFYPTGIRMPTIGRWMMVATAGNNWGCFVLTVR